MSALGKIFGFGDSLKRRLRDAISNPSDYAEMTADQNQNEWKRNPDERSLGFFNPVPLGTMGNFVLRKSLEDALPSMSRREFMKKSAGLAGGTAAASIPGTKLLQKFAPEEKAIAKEVAVEAAPKYKYNSLEEYLDDVESKVYSRYDDAEPMSAMSNRDQIRERLLQDEQAYKTAKDNLARPNPKKDFNTGLPPKSQVDQMNAFSPQAKQEMKEFKSLTKQIDTDYTGTHDWTEWAIKNMKNPTSISTELKRWYIP